MRPAFAAVAARGDASCTSAAPPDCSATRAALELEACQRLLEVLERRAAVLELLSEALDPHRTVVRVGPELDGAALRGAALRRRDVRAREPILGAVGLLGPLRMDYDKAIRAVRAAALELSRLVEDVYEES